MAEPRGHGGGKDPLLKRQGVSNKVIYKYRGVNPGLGVARAAAGALAHALVVLHNAWSTGHENSHNG